MLPELTGQEEERRRSEDEGGKSGAGYNVREQVIAGYSRL